MKSILFLFAFAGVAAQATEYTRIPCDSYFSQVTWPHLAANERALGEAFNLIVMHSGSQKTTNCSVEYPVQAGQPLDGPRTVVMDSQWYAIRIVDGKEVRIFRQEGIKVNYSLGQSATGGKLRDVNGFWVCRTPEMCRTMGIPFAGGDPHSTDPIPGPTPTF